MELEPDLESEAPGLETTLGTLPPKRRPFLDLERLESASRRPGMIIITGPTGCGKRTLGYGLMIRQSPSGLSMATIEDPVRYSLPGVNQHPVFWWHGVTQPDLLRHLLSTDLDVLLAKPWTSESWKLVFQHAIRGRRVYTEMHATGAAEAVSRLMDCSIPAADIAASVNLVHAQRLVRGLCPKCKVPYVPSSEVMDYFRWDLEELGGRPFVSNRLYRAGGCEECEDGYKGHYPITEQLLFDPVIRDLVRSGDFDYRRLRRAARARGMWTLRESGLRRVRRGETTLEEVVRVTRSPDQLR